MTRPTLGREVSSPTTVRPDRFPCVLASALDRVAQPSASRPLVAVPPPPGDGPAEQSDDPAPGPVAVHVAEPGRVAPGGVGGRRALHRRGTDTGSTSVGGTGTGSASVGVTGTGGTDVGGTGTGGTGTGSPGPGPGTGTGTEGAADRGTATGAVRMALVPAVGAAAGAPERDTPGAVRDHLIETVEPEALPLWRAHLAVRSADTRRLLVEHHAPLVRGIGAKLATRLPSSIELADLLQSGTFGLIDAVDRFDPARGVRFEGYAAQRVRGAMLDELRAQDWVPRTVRSRSREIERAREAVQSKVGRPASDRELAAELGIGLRDLRQAVRPALLVSADDLDGNAAPGPAALAAADTADPVATAVRRETGAELRAAIAQLGERDRTVLRLYYVEDHTLAEIGALLGVTESRVCQLHTRMLTRLRTRMEPALAG
ncbi:sigma-70 family RNA polymerase sigma factor [Pseudonocardia sp. Ae263_Ps1]|uniref:sigma-70 family RNA polymerase sigma factor n=1 Tax=Pseudonocardia sp. Ae263_Ps1 TaxID=1885030 RepID=UPI0011151206|nr:FliA/WhiG family RNA polymerase sigma factor [Pseudonocardia sp. Ae263_Ps1]